MRFEIIISLILLSSLGCGIKGPPLPPLKETPPLQVMEPSPSPTPQSAVKKRKKK